MFSQRSQEGFSNRLMPSSRPYSSSLGWSTWWWGSPRTGRPQRKPPGNRRPELCDGCSSRPGSRTDRRVGDRLGRDTAGRNPLGPLASDRCLQPAKPGRLHCRRSEPKPQTGFHHSWRRQSQIQESNLYGLLIVFSVVFSSFTFCSLWFHSVSFTYLFCIPLVFQLWASSRALTAGLPLEVM